MNIKLVHFLFVVLLTGFTPALSRADTMVSWGDSLAGGAGGIPWVDQYAALSGNSVINNGVGGETTTQVLSRFLAAPTLWSDYTVLWAGRNNYLDAPTVESDIAAMVARLTTEHYLVLSILNGYYPGWESIGDTGYIDIMALNANLSATYGQHYLDVRQALLSAYNPSSPADVFDVANGIVPDSLRSDVIHLNTAGYNIVAKAVNEAFISEVPLPSSWPLLASALCFLVFALSRSAYRRQFLPVVIHARR